MGWARARFKGKEVWAEVDAAGQAVVEGGRVRIRYSRSEGARLYRAGASRVEVSDGAVVEELPEGVPADKAGPSRSRRGSGFGSAGTRTVQQKAMAIEDARARIAALGPEVVRCFTDGSCRGNPGPAGSGAVVQLPDGRVAEASRSLGRGTNNVGELDGIALVLEILDEAGVPTDAPVAVFTDSSYSHGVLCRGWKAKANKERIASLRQRLAARPGVGIHWIAGHVGLEGNERADALANLGVDGVTATKWTQDPPG